MLARGLCAGHLRQQKKCQRLTPLRNWSREAKTCAIAGCADVAICRGLCNRHYKRRFPSPNGAALARAARLRREYAIDEDAYNALFLDQGGECAICGGAESAKRGVFSKRLAVDHDHQSGVVRGLLCQNCNTALGLMGDDSSRLLLAVGYLKKFNHKGK